MSAGTMFACACKEIVMGKQSNLGPIDPQFGGIPAQGVIDEVNRAIEEVKNNPSRAFLWKSILSKYHPTFIGECEHAIELSKSLVKEWLLTGMLQNNEDKLTNIIDGLGSHNITKTHARHIHIDECIKMGLNISKMEDDNELQDIILTVHHAFMHTFPNSNSVKIIENHNGIALVTFYRQKK